MDANPKQQIVEKLQSAKNVLVTVSKDPSVDQLATAVGLTLMLNALDIRTTAVYSGQTPNALEFLEPGKVIESSVDGLRDFIISIDKEKADKLRYKIEENMVRIFITPYKTTLTEQDLTFAQGEYQVGVVLALGVNNKSELDQAITSHGSILHDAAIISITSGSEPPGDLGSINWHDPTASCLAEMIVSISEALKSGVIDKSISTAFLTGIISATERFSNEKTSPKVMTMAAQLMAAGADQALIAQNLRMDRGRSKDLDSSSQDEKPLAEVGIEEHGDDLKIMAEIEHDTKPAKPDQKTEEHSPDDPELSVEGPDDGHEFIKSPESEAQLRDDNPTSGSPFSATIDEAQKRAQELAKNTPDGLAPNGFTPDVEMTPAHKEPELKTEEEVDDAVAIARSQVEAAISGKPLEPTIDGAGLQPVDMVGTDQPIAEQIDIDAKGLMTNLNPEEPSALPPASNMVTPLPTMPPPPVSPPPLPGKPADTPLASENRPDNGTPTQQPPTNPLFRQQ